GVPLPRVPAPHPPPLVCPRARPPPPLPPPPASPGWPHLHPEHAHAVPAPPPPETPRSPQCHPDPRHEPPAPWAHHAHGNRGRDERYRAEQHTRRGSADQRNRSEHRERLTRPGQPTEAEQSTRPGRPTGVEQSTRAGPSTRAGWPTGSAGSPRRDDHPLGAEEITASPGRSQPRPADP